MHKNIIVADIEIDEKIGIIRKINKLYDEKHLPVGINVKKELLIESHLMNGGKTVLFQLTVLG